MTTPPVFTTGAVLTAAQMNAVGMWKITPTTVSGTGVSITSNNVTFSGSTEIICDGVFSSEYRDYLIMCDFSSTQEDSFNLQYRTGTTTATGYNSVLVVLTSGTPAGGPSTGGTAIRVGATNINAFHSLEAKIFTPNVASVPTRHHSTFNRSSSASIEFVVGTQTATTQFTGFRLSIATGTVTGTLQIYGYTL